jgi:hypothetical protein
MMTHRTVCLQEERKEEEDRPKTGRPVGDRSMLKKSQSAPARQAPNLNIGRQTEDVETPQGGGGEK